MNQNGKYRDPTSILTLYKMINTIKQKQPFIVIVYVLGSHVKLVIQTKDPYQDYIVSLKKKNQEYIR